MQAQGPSTSRGAPEEAVANSPSVLGQKKAYYGNICNVCFKMNDLKTCSKCHIIAYCSKDHQTQDWPTHKSICSKVRKADAKIKCKENCSFEEFIKYREERKLEILKEPIEFYEYEAQICNLPWVCSICYSKNVTQQCDSCKSVVYCCVQHKEQDKKQHSKNCTRIHLCRLLDSLTYEHGYKLQGIRFKFDDIPRRLKIFPEKMDELARIVNKRIFHIGNTHDGLCFIIHNDLYGTPATIIRAFQDIGSLYKRIYTKKPFLTRHQRKIRLAERLKRHMANKLDPDLNEKPPMVLHFVAAGPHEVSLHWPSFVHLFISWFLNVDYLEIILVGKDLRGCEPPKFQSLTEIAGFQLHTELYKDVVGELLEPDMVILLCYDHDKTNCIDELNELESQRALFKYKKVPVLITSTKEEILKSYVDKLMENPGVQVQVDTHFNFLSQTRPHRIWEEKNITTYVRNAYVAVLTRH